VFAALTDPHLTTRFWFTKSTGPMVAGAQLTWTWEMYRVSSAVSVTDVEPDQRVRLTWSGYDPAHPTTVEFRFVPWAEGAAGDTAEGTYVLVTETGFSGDGDTLVGRVIHSATGFTFMLSSLKAFLEHDVVLRVVLDAHPSGLQI
jgi:uncharacterized protein YndB with AHSA1/START domain